MHVRFAVQRIANRFGYTIERKIPADLDERTVATIRRVHPISHTSPEAIAALCSAVAYVVESDVPGDLVECGVFKGGSMMAVALTLRQLGVSERTLWLYDTFEGMTEPTELDVRLWDGAVPAARFASGSLPSGGHEWANASLEETRANMADTGYPAERIRYVVGRVEDTIPASAPERIALLRLDTDFHDSTRHELEHLYPRLVSGGVLVVDDYGSWSGARKAVDDFRAAGNKLHLVRVDSTVHLAVKP